MYGSSPDTKKDQYDDTSSDYSYSNSSPPHYTELGGADPETMITGHDMLFSSPGGL